MSKNTKSKKLTAFLLLLVLVTSLFVGGTIARYITSTSSEDSARVAVWGFNTPTPTVMDLFKNEYKLEDDTIVAKSNDGDKIIAPGLNGVSKFNIVTANANLAPEVMYAVRVNVNDSLIADAIKNNTSIQWKVDNSNWGTWDEMKANLLALSGDPSGMKVYAPGTVDDNFKNGAEHTIAWQWLMDAGNDEMDTAMGNLATEGDISAKIVVEITATQTDDLITNGYMVDGANSLVNANNIQPLTFRSSAPLEDLERVEVNGTEITKGTDYTATEGSTIITLSTSFLESLGEGEFTVDIISKDITASTTFKILNNEISHSGTIPVGGTYYVNVGTWFDDIAITDRYRLGVYGDYESKYEAGDEFPEPQTGDVYVYGDYEYRYNMEHSKSYQNESDKNIFIFQTKNSLNGWSVTHLDNSNKKSTNILSSIANKDVKPTKDTFYFVDELYFVGLTEEDYNNSNFKNALYIYTNGNIPSKPTFGDMYIIDDSYYLYGTGMGYNDYMQNTFMIYKYNMEYNEPIQVWETNSNLNGWGVNIIKFNADKLKTVIGNTRVKSYTTNWNNAENLTKLNGYYFENIYNNIPWYTEYVSKASAIYSNIEDVKNGPFMGDTYIKDNYLYFYNIYDDGSDIVEPAPSQNGWLVHFGGKWNDVPFDKNITILSNINNKDVVNMRAAFTHVVTDTLINPPTIPNTIKDLRDSFSWTPIRTAPIIPESVEYMDSAFMYCTNLSGTIEINANNIKSYNNAFTGVDLDAIEITGSISDTMKIAIKYNLESVTDDDKHHDFIIQGKYEFDSAFDENGHYEQSSTGIWTGHTYQDAIYYSNHDVIPFYGNVYWYGDYRYQYNMKYNIETDTWTKVSTNTWGYMAERPTTDEPLESIFYRMVQN